MKPNPREHARFRAIANRLLLLAGFTLVFSVESGVAQRLELKRDLKIGAVEGAPELEFQTITAIGVSADGTLYIADGGSKSIRVFSRSGKFIRQWGRLGEGPGEFQYVTSIRFHGDTVFTADTRLFRVTAFSREGAVLGTWRTGASNPDLAIPLTAVAGGWLMQTSHRPPEFINDAPRIGEVRQFTLWFGVTPKFDIRPDSTRAIATYKSQRWIGVQVPGRTVTTMPLFEPVPDHAADERGLLYLSPGSPYRIDVLDSTGKRIRSLTRGIEPVAITPAMLDRFRAHVTRHYDSISPAGMVQPQMRAQARAAQVARADLPKPNSVPPLGELMVSPGGVVWVTRIDRFAQPVDTYLSWRPRQATPWDVFDSNGDFIGSAETPANFAMRAVTEREIIGVERDELDVQYVVRYRFR